MAQAALLLLAALAALAAAGPLGGNVPFFDATSLDPTFVACLIPQIDLARNAKTASFLSDVSRGSFQVAEGLIYTMTMELQPSSCAIVADHLPAAESCTHVANPTTVQVTAVFQPWKPSVCKLITLSVSNNPTKDDDLVRIARGVKTDSSFFSDNEDESSAYSGDAAATASPDGESGDGPAVHTDIPSITMPDVSTQEPFTSAPPSETPRDNMPTAFAAATTHSVASAEGNSLDRTEEMVSQRHGSAGSRSMRWIISGVVVGAVAVAIIVMIVTRVMKRRVTMRDGMLIPSHVYSARSIPTRATLYSSAHSAFKPYSRPTSAIGTEC